MVISRTEVRPMCDFESRMARVTWSSEAMVTKQKPLRLDVGTLFCACTFGK
jgi:hypothetical protein